MTEPQRSDDEAMHPWPAPTQDPGVRRRVRREGPAVETPPTLTSDPIPLSRALSQLPLVFAAQAGDPSHEPDVEGAGDSAGATIRPVSEGDAEATRPRPGADELDEDAALRTLAAEVPEPLLPVVLALGCTIRSSREAGEDLARLVNRITEHLLGVGGPYRPTTVAEMSLAATRAFLGSEHPFVLDALANLAVSYQSAARGAEALAAFDQVLAERDRLGGPGPRSSSSGAPRTTRVAVFSGRSVPPGRSRSGSGCARDLLAQCLDEQGRIDVPVAVALINADGPPGMVPVAGTLADAVLSSVDAVESLAQLLNRATAHLLGVGGAYRPTALAKAVLGAAAAHLGPEHPATLRACVNLAVAQRSAGHAAEAVPRLEAVLADLERLLGPEHPDTLTALGHLGTSYQSTGRVAEALPIFERVAADRGRLLGAEHPETLTARTNLAACLHAAGRRSRAVALFQQVAADSHRGLGPEDPDTLNTLSNLAAAYQSDGRLAEALALFEQVLVARTRVLGPDHPETLAARSELALSYQSAGRTARALASFGRVLADRARLFGPEDSRTLDARLNLALALRSADRTAEALALFQRLDGECERVLGPDHATTRTVLANLAACYLATGRTAEALPVFERLAADRERRLGPEDPSTLDALSDLAAAYESVGRTAKAAAIVKRVLAARRRVPGPDASGRGGHTLG